MGRRYLFCGGDDWMRELPVRKRIRLEDYDYSQNGAYFITLCVKDRHELLGKIHVGEHIVLPQLSKIGKIVETSIKNIGAVYRSIKVDKYVIMPNHVHMILCIKTDSGSTMCSPTISRIIKHCKEYVTKECGYSIWQRAYHDHIIRSEADYRRIWQYIDENPERWEEDIYFAERG
jgi:REP element-mobilizing transposase RayT